MGVKIFQVDAFANKPFTGNPAAVCLLREPRDEIWMQNVAREMKTHCGASIKHIITEFIFT